ncbi:MAG: hypothetical protein ACO3ZW_08750 [Opitutales bacterium]|jgi:hypothetical protein
MDPDITLNREPVGSIIAEASSDLALTNPGELSCRIRLVLLGISATVPLPALTTVSIGHDWRESCNPAGEEP